MKKKTNRQLIDDYDYLSNAASAMDCTVSSRLFRYHRMSWIHTKSCTTTFRVRPYQKAKRRTARTEGTFLPPSVNRPDIPYKPGILRHIRALYRRR